MRLSFNMLLRGIFILGLLLPGCAGGGLKNMFSRDDTAGYRTLDEIEADEAKKASDETAVADAGSEKPRFSPWLPLAKKPSATTVSDESLAVTKPADDEVSPKYGKWWQRAFRTRDPYESDPFLAEGNDIADEKSNDVDDSRQGVETLTVSSDSENDPLKEADTAAAKSNTSVGRMASLGKSESLKQDVRAIPVGETRTAGEANQTEDELLAGKFEQQFRKSSVAAVEKIEDAEPLIAAGKSKAGSTVREAKSRTQKTAEAKLSELEELLAERRTSAVNAARQKQSVVQSQAVSELDEVSKVADDLVAEVAKAESATRKKASSAARMADSNVSGFDRLLMEAKGEIPADSELSSTQTSSARAVSKKTTSKKTQASDDVHVASAEDLFGVESPATKKSSARKTRTLARSSSLKSNEEDGFEWQQSRLGTTRPGSLRGEEDSVTVGDTADSEERQAVTLARPKREVIPPSSSGNAAASGRKDAREKSSPFRNVSTSGMIDEPAFRSSNEPEPAVVSPTVSDKFAGD
ncbi:MAG: hypothetical protein ACK58L_20460 [Planctomycetota bacterium]